MQYKHVIGATGFFGLGALVAWAITADKYDRRVDMAYMIGYASADAAASLKLHDQEYVNDGETENPNQISLLEEDLREISVPEEIDEDVIPVGETPEETRSNLQNLIDTYTADPDAQAEFADIASRAEEYDKVPPFVISREDYAYDEEGEHHEKITLTYYPRDRVLLDDDEDPIDDIPAQVGWRSLSQFGGTSGDPDVVFVRNRRLMTDYEVVKEESQELPLHVKYGMDKEEFRVNKAAGLIKLRQEDE